MKRYVKGNVEDRNIVIDISTINILTDIYVELDYDESDTFDGEVEFISIDGERFYTEFRYEVEMPGQYSDGDAYLIDCSDGDLFCIYDENNRIDCESIENISALEKYIEGAIYSEFKRWILRFSD